MAITATLAQDFPVAISPTLTIVAGDDYSSSASTQIVFTIASAMADITSASGTALKILWLDANGTGHELEVFGTASGSVGSQTITFTLTAAQTQSLAGAAGASVLFYNVLALPASSNAITLCYKGTVVLR
jgi:hypothetical protein